MNGKVLNPFTGILAAQYVVAHPISKLWVRTLVSVKIQPTTSRKRIGVSKILEPKILFP